LKILIIIKPLSSVLSKYTKEGTFFHSLRVKWIDECEIKKNRKDRNSNRFKIIFTRYMDLNI